jgi:uncharacterized cupin superfamily protein
MIGQRVDAQKLEYNITVVSPGKRAWPLHNHRVNEEMFFIIACPAGGKETAHQIINTGTEELRYLAVSTQFSHEVAEYPDSVKFAVSVERSISPDGKPQRRVFVGRESQSLKYWDGE